MTGAPFVDCAKLYRQETIYKENSLPKIAFTQSYNCLCNFEFDCRKFNSLIDNLSELYIKDESYFDSFLMNELIMFGAYNLIKNKTKSEVRWRPHPSARSKISLNYFNYLY